MQKKSHHIIYNIFFLLVLSSASCNEWYNHPLGNHLSLWDGDGDKDRIIVYCEGNCHGGIRVLPTYERSTNNGEYVESATSNKKWVIAKTLQVKDNKENYYIINISKDFDIENVDCAKVNCDSILQSHVTGPLSLPEFKNKVQALNIDLDFK